MTGQPVVDYESAKTADTAVSILFSSLLEEGIYIAPSQFEALFVSSEHTEDILDQTVTAFGRAFTALTRSKT